MLAMLLPATLPKATSSPAAIAEPMLTANSGALVPVTTTVKPITTGWIPNRAAIAAALSTRSSAP
ncbi:MAG: hypothetical protein R2715_08140 [Ilumatobacteraceae bacterium]